MSTNESKMILDAIADQDEDILRQLAKKDTSFSTDAMYDSPTSIEYKSVTSLPPQHDYHSAETLPAIDIHDPPVGLLTNELSVGIPVHEPVHLQPTNENTKTNSQDSTFVSSVSVKIDGNNKNEILHHFYSQIDLESFRNVSLVFSWLSLCNVIFKYIPFQESKMFDVCYFMFITNLVGFLITTTNPEWFYQRNNQLLQCIQGNPSYQQVFNSDETSTSNEIALRVRGWKMYPLYVAYLVFEILYHLVLICLFVLYAKSEHISANLNVWQFGVSIFMSAISTNSYVIYLSRRKRNYDRFELFGI